MLLQEGPTNTVPRPRFKINDGQNEQVESIISHSHFSQSEINNETEGGEPTFSDHGTATLGLNKVQSRLQDRVKKGQHNSDLNLTSPTKI